MRIEKADLARIYNEFRFDNPNYMGRLPLATAANVIEVGGRIANNETMFNDFARVAVKYAQSYLKTPKFTNPLAKHKRAVSPYGDIIEEIFIGLVKSRAFRGDDSAKDLFSAETPNISSAYFRKNRRDKYAIVIDEIELKRSLETGEGLGNVIESMLASMHTSNNYDEYLLTRLLLDGAVKKGETWFVEVGDVFNDPEARRRFLKKAKFYHGKTKFPNTYNAAGVLTTAPADEMTLFTTVALDTELDVEELASAYNMNVANFIGVREQLDEFADPNVLAVYMENSGIIVADALNQVTSQPNASNLTTKYWLHIHQYIARSPFATSIAFVIKIPDDMRARLTVSRPVGIIAPQLEKFDLEKSFEVVTSLEGYDGVTDDFSEYTLTAVADVPGVDIEVDGNKATIHATEDAEPGENFTVTFTATYGEGKTVKTKGHYSISYMFGQD